ncbi:PREDICTED: NAC transcription factor 29-like isoform X3 [Tarenaya hassleriana]|uniref:NAC transcription factor 29-like isoform X3 n=1 Tax=Tarenaya hassleriana TaxID=28532 RepID=UPI00053C14A8|nr:PREDICTED: NAC transcription factor 29-like isoform X3 [Tarenaya hassleriana]
MVLKWKMKGFGFRPTDQELIEDYLNYKNLGDDTPVHEAINEINIYRFDPWDLRGQSKIQSEDDQIWHFFSPRNTKYSKSKRSNRKTENGYWKVTGRDRSIKGTSKKVIGTKKTLVFYRGRVPSGIKTDWVMHEYHSSALTPDKTIGQAEETPNSVCNTGGFDTDLGLMWDELDEESPMLDSILLNDFSFIDNIPLLSEFCSPLEDLEVETQSMPQFANSVSANHSSETVHSQMQSDLITWSCPDHSSNIDSETVSLWMNQCSPGASAGERSFNTK